MIAPGASWVVLTGGRTNATWRIDTTTTPNTTPNTGPNTGTNTGPNALPDTGPAPTSIVCKLYRPGGDTPLFANDPGAEAEALAALTGSDLAPRLIAAGETPAGGSLLYTHVPGRPWRDGDDPAPVARALSKLHAAAPPKGLSRLPLGGAALAAQAQEMLDGLGAPGRALAELIPDGPPLRAATPVFLHGDATAGNVLVGSAGITFIDWQCPALGDATADLATFLSPAMQALSGNVPLSPEAEAAFLAAYGDPKVAARYRALARLYHARMAAYCLWRAARGDAGYGPAAELEIAQIREA